MTTSEQAAPTRRERQRQATYDEIVAVSRGLLRAQEALSLRAVAHEMGVTAPALYRYVDSYHELLGLVAEAIFDDVVSSLAAARARYGDDDPGAQILASAVAFRQWAVTNPDEFGLIFASPATRGQGPGDEHDGAKAFGQLFSDIYLRLWHRYQFPVPTEEDLGPDVADAMRAAQSAESLPCEFPSEVPFGLSWSFVRCWSRLYGTVTLEVFRHMAPEVIDSGALFRSMLADLSGDLGLGDDWPRLQAISSAELAGPV